MKVKSRQISDYISNMKFEIEKQQRDERRGATYLGKGAGLVNMMETSGKAATKK